MTDEALDHISNLPDPILCHILSFIPTKSAVKTSILSERWKSLWTKVPTLDFSEMPCSKKLFKLTGRQKSCFNAFVDRVLLHNNVSHVGRLCLRLQDVDFYVKSWLSAIARREIDEIDISLIRTRLPDLIPLPERFLSSDKLVKLQLHGELTIEDPTSVHLPNLEVIVFRDLQLPNDEFMKRLLPGCPVLEQLCILECSGITDTLYLESPTLKRLEISNTVRDDTTIVIKAPNLRYLALEDTLSEYDISDLNSLLKADLLLFGHVGGYANEFEIVSKVSAVKSLKLFEAAQWVFEYFDQPPVFQNLTHLELEDDTEAYTILKCAPNLVSLVVTHVSSWDGSFVGLSVPQCLSCLESVEVSGFSGTKQQVSMIAYFLKNAARLKEMKLVMRQMSTKCERDLTQKLLMLPRSSATCRVKVLYYALR